MVCFRSAFSRTVRVSVCVFVFSAAIIVSKLLSMRCLLVFRLHFLLSLRVPVTTFLVGFQLSQQKLRKLEFAAHAYDYR